MKLDNISLSRYSLIGSQWKDDAKQMKYTNTIIDILYQKQNSNL